MTIRLTFLAALLLGVSTTLAARRADDGRLKDAELVLTEMAGSFDTGIPKSLFSKARCVVIIPGVKKAAWDRRPIWTRLHLLPARQRMERAGRHPG